MKKKTFSVILFFVCCIGFFVSCHKSGKIQSISEDSLFSIEYGNFEEQINLFNLSKPGDIKTSVFMRDGFFYIVNGESQKILSMNSYGDLLSLYYNEDLYPESKKGLPEKSPSKIWKPVSYPFDVTGKITVDSRKYMYVVANVPRDRYEQDEDENLLYSQVVLRFSSDGSSVDYLGQQGPGGTPFPYIKEIYTTENDELVVVCTTNVGLTTFWFATNGFLRYKIPISIKSAPKINTEALSDVNPDAVFVTIENAVPDCYALRLYIKVDYSVALIDEESKVQSGIEYKESYILPLNVETGKYGEPLALPPFEQSVTEDFSKITYKLPYDFLGVTKSGWLFFIITTEDGFNIEMLQPVTQIVQKRHLAVNHNETLYYSLCLSHEGIISALLAEKNSAKIVWWRTDSLIDSVIK